MLARTVHGYEFAETLQKFAARYRRAANGRPYIINLSWCDKRSFTSQHTFSYHTKSHRFLQCLVDFFVQL